MQRNKKAIVWFTNNLRVNDNTLLQEACSHHDQVIAVYCFDKDLFSDRQFGFKKIEKFRAKFLIQSVADLQKNLAELNIPLFTYFGSPEKTISNLCGRFQAQSLYVQKEFTQEEEIGIEKVKSNLPEFTTLISLYDQFLFHPDDIQFEIKDIPEVFSNFRRKVEKSTPVHYIHSNQVSNVKTKIENDTHIPTLNELGFDEFEIPRYSAFPFEGGESHALQRLNDYFFVTKKLSVYKKTRNGLLGINYSSKFSPWLANGSISARTIYHYVKKYESEFGSNQSTYWLIFELIWRDYFKYLSLKHGNKLFTIEGIKERSLSWSEDHEKLQSWIHGHTHESFVNANMIELQRTGWMSNRGRQNVASFFSKELLLDWRIGAAYFESMLIDYDVHSNYGNWQYVSGVGNDPRNRKFNIGLQAKRYDPHGKFQRHWLEPSLFS